MYLYVVLNIYTHTWYDKLYPDHVVFTSGGDGSNDLQHRILLSLPLWARRLHRRSDSLLRIHTAAAATTNKPETLSAKQTQEETDDELAQPLQHSAATPPVPPTPTTIPTLFGDCLDVAAVKALAAPADSLSFRVFAVLAGATVPGTDSGTVPGTESENVPGHASATISGTASGTVPATVSGTVSGTVPAPGEESEEEGKSAAVADAARGGGT